MSDARSRDERSTPGHGPVARPTRDASVTMWRAPGLSDVPGVVHGFTGRTTHPDDPRAPALDLARRGGVPDDELASRWQAVARGLHPGLSASDVVLLHQVHGARVLRATGPTGPLAVLGEADAVFTDVPGLVLAIRTADCVPVLLAGRRHVGAAHSGWRGTVAGVVPALVDALRAAGEAPSRLVAAVGPAISGEAYEVGDEVVQGLRAAGLDDRDFLHPGGDRPHVDLRAAVRAQLLRAGVGRVDVLPHCTVHDPRLHSHRRDGAASGRQAAVIARCP